MVRGSTHKLYVLRTLAPARAAAETGAYPGSKPWQLRSSSRGNSASAPAAATGLREQLLEQIKKDKEETAWYERNSGALEQSIKQAEEELEKLDSGGPAADAEDAKKYQKLQEKDQEMSDFIAKHDDTMLKERDAIKETERRIVQLLEHISKDLGRSHQLPSKEGYLDMKNEVAMKQRGLDNSQTTAERLKSEQTMRQAHTHKSALLHVVFM